MTLKEKKFENYSTLSELLFKLEDVIRNWYREDLRDVKRCSELMKRPMNCLFIREIDTWFDVYIRVYPGVAENTEGGYSITMIAPESENEADPVKDILKLNKVEDVFWAKGIVNNAFLSLFPKEDK